MQQRHHRCIDNKISSQKNAPSNNVENWGSLAAFRTPKYQHLARFLSRSSHVTRIQYTCSNVLFIYLHFRGQGPWSFEFPIDEVIPRSSGATGPQVGHDLQNSNVSISALGLRTRTLLFHTVWLASLRWLKSAPRLASHFNLNQSLMMAHPTFSSGPVLAPVSARHVRRDSALPTSNERTGALQARYRLWILDLHVCVALSLFQNGHWPAGESTVTSLSTTPIWLGSIAYK